MRKTWLVTGSNRGLGMATVQAALEAGGMRTGWGSGAARGQGAILPDYDSSVGGMRRMLRACAGLEVGHPAKIARVIVELTRRIALPYHLTFGSDALAAFDAAERERREQAEGWLPVSRLVDF